MCPQPDCPQAQAVCQCQTGIGAASGASTLQSQVCAWLSTAMPPSPPRGWVSPVAGLAPRGTALQKKQRPCSGNAGGRDELSRGEMVPGACVQRQEGAMVHVDDDRGRHRAGGSKAFLVLCPWTASWMSHHGAESLAHVLRGGFSGRGPGKITPRGGIWKSAQSEL